MKAGRLEDAATAKSDLQTTQATKADDEKMLSDTTAQCQARSEEYEKNQWYLADTLYRAGRYEEALVQYDSLMLKEGHPFRDGAKWQTVQA